MELIDIVRKLIGEIEPVAETYTDDERYENLKKWKDLTDSLLCEICKVARFHDDMYGSRQRAGQDAMEYLKSIHEGMENEVE